MEDVRKKVIGTINGLPESVTYDEILEAIIIQKQFEESEKQFEEDKFISHKEVMAELDRRIKGLTK